jgi:hypothetical protein
MSTIKVFKRTAGGVLTTPATTIMAAVAHVGKLATQASKQAQRCEIGIIINEEPDDETTASPGSKH